MRTVGEVVGGGVVRRGCAPYGAERRAGREPGVWVLGGFSGSHNPWVEIGDVKVKLRLTTSVLTESTNVVGNYLPPVLLEHDRQQRTSSY